MTYIIEAFVWEGLRKTMKIFRIEAGFQDEVQTPGHSNRNLEPDI
jgi:hypothetical protein